MHRQFFKCTRSLLERVAKIEKISSIRALLSMTPLSSTIWHDDLPEPALTVVYATTIGAAFIVHTLFLTKVRSTAACLDHG
jgi:hypothetical protein